MADVVVARRFRGPPSSGNGGYVCGLVAAAVGPSAEVTLRRPVPLDVPLSLIAEPGAAHLYRDDQLLAEGRESRVDIADPRTATFEAALDASRRVAAGDRTHPLPGCFVCGPERAPGDGMRLRPGPLIDAPDVLAAPWVPDEVLADEAGQVREEFVWSALDCPTGFAALQDESHPPMLLGRLAASIRQRPRAGERCVVTAWPKGQDGRKLFADAALIGQAGDILALARATWVLVSRETLLGIDRPQ